MGHARHRSASWGFALGALALLAPACLTEPDVWPCKTEADCGSEESCIDGKCRADSTCNYDTDCDSGYLCVASHCTATVPPTGGTGGAGGHGGSGGDAGMGGLGGSTSVGGSGGSTTIGGAGGSGGSNGDGPGCDRASDCSTGICCDGTCATACGTRLPGDLCTSDLECLSGDCLASAQCGPCADARCTDAVCGSDHCGFVSGADCGECRGRKYCDGNQCLAACAGVDCGSDHGFDCGSCGDGFVCSKGHCDEETCEVGAFWCEGDDLFHCIDGAASDFIDTCVGSWFCQPGHDACQPSGCGEDPGFCSENQYFACTGSHRKSLPPELCEPPSSCTPAGCAVVQTDTIDVPSPAAAQDQTICGNVYEVDSTVTLVDMTQTMGESGAPEMWWFIYEGTDPEGPFTLAVPRITSPSHYAAGVVTSPSLLQTLEAGKFYFLGLAANATVYELGASATAPQAVSFGKMLAGACSTLGMPQELAEIVHQGVVPQTLRTTPLN